MTPPTVWLDANDPAVEYMRGAVYETLHAAARLFAVFSDWEEGGVDTLDIDAQLADVKWARKQLRKALKQLDAALSEPAP